MYRMILKAEYLPCVWTTWEMCVYRERGAALCEGVILTAQVKLVAAATCNCISYILQDA